jgi:rhodanese-related sulfurtransferase
MKKTALFGGLACVSLAAVSFAAESAPPSKPTIARICTNCHKAESGVLMGHFDNVAFKAKTIQLKLDDRVELLKFDEDEIKVKTSEGKQGDGELLKKTKKGHEIRIVFTESKGVKTATGLVERPPAKVAHDMLIATAELEKLVALGPAKGKYYLFDSRPAIRFQEGAIPTSTNLPFSSFDMMVENLPKDKNAQIIFYDTGPDCILSSDSALKAQKLGYTNIRVYRDGAPGWAEKHYSILSSAFLNDAWMDKSIPHVLLDVRTSASSTKEHIRGAVAFPASQAAKLYKNLPPKEKRPPIIIYDNKGGKDAEIVAANLIKSGYNRVMILAGGFENWRSAKFEVVSGKLATSATYIPQPRVGEIALDEFKQYAALLPSDVMIIDVRNEDEIKTGMFKTAINIPEEEISEKSARIPKDKLIITQCASGVRAEMAYHALKELGYQKVKFLNAKVVFEQSGVYKITKD